MSSALSASPTNAALISSSSSSISVSSPVASLSAKVLRSAYIRSSDDVFCNTGASIPIAALAAFILACSFASSSSRLSSSPFLGNSVYRYTVSWGLLSLITRPFRWTTRCGFHGMS